MPKRKKNKSTLPTPRKLPKPSVQQAIKNITIVVANVRMTRQEHQQLQQDLMLVTQRCELADKLEEEKE